MRCVGAVLTLAEKRRFLRLVVLTPISAVNEDSILCQKVEYSVGSPRRATRGGPANPGTHETDRDSRTMKVTMPDKLRAIELDAKLAGELREQVVLVEVADVGIGRARIVRAHLQSLRAGGPNCYPGVRRPWLGAGNFAGERGGSWWHDLRGEPRHESRRHVHR